MEWMHISQNLDNDCPKLDELVKSLIDTGYEAWGANLLKPLEATSMNLIVSSLICNGCDFLLDFRTWRHSMIVFLFNSVVREGEVKIG